MSKEVEKEFFEAFFKPVYRFYYYTYDTDIISGHSDKTKCYIDMEIEKSKFTFEKLQKVIVDGYSIVLNEKPYQCFRVEKYQPTFKITSNIVLELEEIILTETSHISHVQKYGYPVLDKAGKKRIGTDWNYIYVVEVFAGCDELDCQNYDRFEGRGKTRVDALLNLCVALRSEIKDEVIKLFKG